MFNLNNANISIRKAAALQGIKSGKFVPVFDGETRGDVAIAKVYNRNHPDGIEITRDEAGESLNWTWEEINNR